MNIKKTFSVLALLGLILMKSQNISSSRWSDLFSYNHILQIREDYGTLIAATENGIFYYSPISGEITKLSKVNGLHQVKISAFDYNPETKVGLVGYANGTLDIIKEDEITYVVDIPLAKGYTGNKKINHISITGNLAVISVDYGISIFNLERKEFSDTSFFISGGSYEPSREAVLKDDTVYSITPSGIKKHTIGGAFPIYSSWSLVSSENYQHIDIDDNLMAFSNSNQVTFGDGNTFNTLPESFSDIQDITINGENIIVTDKNKISVFNNNSEIANLSTNQSLKTSWFSNGKIYAGSQYEGILDNQLKSYKPDGPYFNVASGIRLLENNQILVSTGNRSGAIDSQVYWTPKLNPKNPGIYYFNGEKWIYPQLFKDNRENTNNQTVFNTLDAIINPHNSKEILFSNYSLSQQGQGIYRMVISDSKETVSFSEILQANNPVGFTKDDHNNLFANSALKTDYGIYDKNKKQFNWKKLESSSVGPSKPIFYDGLLWIPSPRGNNLLTIDLKNTPENLNDDVSYIATSENNLPSSRILTIDIDKSGTAWIGTMDGLRILYNASSTVRENPKFEPIIISQKGLGEELFRDTQVLYIKSDKGNQKWISISDGGVFYLSSNGQETIHHFTKDNSPIPNNTVTDIEIDDATGKVYFVTADGIVTYQSDINQVTSNFGNVLVYPNPVVYANYKGNVRIKGLAERTNIRITDVNGNLVHQAVAKAGYYEWNLTNNGQRVASGIYFVLMTNEDGTDKATAKIAVIN